MVRNITQKVKQNDKEIENKREKLRESENWSE